MSSSTKVALRYIVGGIFISGFWYLNRSHSPLEEAFRTLCVFGALLLFAKARIKREAIELHLMPLFLSKALLVGAAAIAETMLVPWLSNPALPVAVGLGLAVAFLGPLGDSHFFTRKPAMLAGSEGLR